jgi:tetrapyrrole methylase family protein/MazG family protein
MQKDKDIGGEFERLASIMRRLRGPGGCPWDREQTYGDINPYMLEEVHEVMEAIDKGDMDALREELGDLLLHIFFHAELAREEGKFDIYDVVHGICEKIIHRHPHVFSGASISDSEAVVRRWEEIKKDEGKESVFDGMPDSLPALLKAYRIGEKVHRVGFDWKDLDGILGKLSEEIRELDMARRRGDKEEVEREYGDLLFTIANIGRFLKVNPEEALRKSSNRFIKRFQRMERLAKDEGLDERRLSDEEWDRLWERAKAEIEGGGS